MDIVGVLGDWASGLGPLHRKLAAALLGAVESGAIPGGTRLPSERRLAAALVVSRSTVVAAYDAVRASGVIEGRQGSGTYVVSRPERRLPGPDPYVLSPGAPIFRRMLAGTGVGAEGDGVISFAAATIPGTPAIAEVIAGWDGGAVMELLAGTGYIPLGLPELRAAVGRLLTTDGLPTEAEDVLVTSGAHQAIALCATLFVRPGDAVVVESPTFPGCADAFAAAGAQLVAVPVDGDGVIVNHIEGVLSRQRVAAIYVMPTFHNPTGAVLSGERRAQLCTLAARAGVPLIEDNALAHTSLAAPGISAWPAPIASHPEADQAPVITVGSLSKVLWGGLRVGWLRAPAPWLARLARRKVAADLGSGVIEQAISAVLVDRLPELEAANSELLHERLDHCSHLLAEHLPTWTWVPPLGGPSLWIRLPLGDAGQFAQVALRHGVEVIPGAAFTTDGSFTDHFRMPFTLEPAVMTEAVLRLVRAWEAYVPDAGRPVASARLGLVV